MKSLIIILSVFAIIAGGLFLIRKSVSSKMDYPIITRPTGITTPEQTEAGATENTVVIKNFTFNPPVLSIKKGTKVTWINQDSAIHSINSNSFDSDNLEQGNQYQFTFNTSGTINYTCDLHPKMKGQIIVE